MIKFSIILFLGFTLATSSHVTKLPLKFDFDFIEKLATRNVSGQCQEHLQRYLAGLKGLSEQWALQMFDSNAKVPEGILYGTTNDFGNFDECLAVRQPDFTGKYCLVDIGLDLGSSMKRAQNPMVELLTKRIDSRDRGNALLPTSQVISYGLCIPSSCFAEDLNQAFQNENIPKMMKISADDRNCYTSHFEEWSPGSWGLISFGAVLLTLAVLSTAYEVYFLLQKPNDSPNRILSSFSMYANTKGLVTIRATGEMDCLHGLRTFSMMWVVLCHTYLSNATAPRINLVDETTVFTSADYIVISNGFFSVDSFFFLSGLLVAFVFFRNIGKSGSFDILVSYIHRYLRLTPGFIIMILFNITMYVQLNKAPLYNKTTSLDQSTCEENWWSSLLYVQNYYNPLGTCLGQSWYLSADMQMYWISPLILYPLYLWPKIGVLFLGALTMAATLWTFALAYVHNYKASIMVMANLDQFGDDYVATHARIVPWLVGVALGFMICAIKARRVTVRLSKVKVAIGWFLSTGVCLGCLYGYYRFEQNAAAPEIEHALYLAFVRLGWGLGLSWVVFACIYGYGGIVNSFLSLGIFQPLGKLSYNVFLIHMTLLSYRTASSKTNGYFNDLNTVYEFLGTLVMANLFALVMYLLVEAPVANLDKELLGGIKLLPYPRPKTVKPAIDVLENGEHK